MVAIASLPTTATGPARARRATPAPRPGPGRSRPVLTLVPTGASAPRPVLTLVPTGASAPRPVAGRSLGSVVATVLLALAVLAAVGYLVSSPTVAPGNATAGTHVVGDGETMWSVAVQHAPVGTAAGYVERLVAANGSASVAPGEELVLPVP